jgi:hypothetical protein
MRLPADQPGERRGDGLIGDEIARASHRRAQDQHDERHAEEPGPADGDESVGRRFGHHGDDATDEPRHRAVAERHQQLDDKQSGEQPFGLAGEVPQKAKQARRRFRIFGRRSRCQDSFEARKHFRLVTRRAWPPSIAARNGPHIERTTERSRDEIATATTSQCC